MIFIHKLLPLFISPLMILFFLVFISLLTKKRVFAVLGLLCGVFFSLSPVANHLVKLAESSAPPHAIQATPQADRVVVLSGILNTKIIDDELIYNYGEAVDRIFAGIALMEAGKAPTLTLTRGKLPWQKGLPEGEVLAQYAIAAGIAEQQIELTPNVQNTAEEAYALRQMMPADQAHIILVTSAFHMPRSVQIFEHYGFQVTPFPADYRQSDRHFTPQDLIPNAEALENSSWVLREFLGRAYYQFRFSFF